MLFQGKRAYCATKPFALALFIALCLAAQIHGQTTPEIVSWKLNKSGAVGYNGLPSDVQKVQYSASFAYISASGIPSYSIGPWAMNPNTPINRNYIYKFPRNPQARTGAKQAVGLGAIGAFLNGVPIFNADDGRTYNNNGVWKRNAFVFEAVSFDACSGHADNTGSYHHHIYPNCLQSIDQNRHSPIVGFAFDGFPVYGAFGYANANGSGGLKRMTPSYRTRAITQRTTLPGSSTVLPAAQQGPAVSAQYPLGSFLQDFEFVQGLGDLDEHNGRFCVTPEYPQGVYAYFVTVEEDLRSPAYPFILGLTYYGTPEPANLGLNGARTPPTEPVVEYVGAATSVRSAQNALNVSISPNPVSESVFIEFDAETLRNDGDIRLVNALGQTVARQSWSGNRQRNGKIGLSLDLSSLSPGIYMLRVVFGNSATIQKIVKQ